MPSRFTTPTIERHEVTTNEHVRGCTGGTCVDRASSRPCYRKNQIMSSDSKIEWTDSTWSPTLGCEKVTDGCANCYAIRTVHRMAYNPHPKVSGAAAGLTSRSDAGDLDWTGKVNLLPDRLSLPLSWRKPRRIFVNSQSDLFHKDVRDEFIARVWAVMAATPQHTYQILTKRHGRMRSLLSSERFKVWTWAAQAELLGTCTPRDMWPLPNVWMGVSVEDQRTADLRIPALGDTPAAVRFVSCEPLLGTVIVRSLLPHQETGEAHPNHPDWIIVGGESGHGARPMHPSWARQLRDQCTAAQVPFFYKQTGEWAPVVDAGDYRNVRETDWFVRSDGYHWPLREPHGVEDGTEVLIRRIGKKAAGRELDGRTWDEFPIRDAES